MTRNNGLPDFFPQLIAFSIAILDSEFTIASKAANKAAFTIAIL
jgi:hypothetical protein